MDSESRARTLIVGGVLGALTGLGAAYLVIRRSEEAEEPLKLGVADGLKLGVLTLGLLRQIGDMADGKQ